MGMTFKQSKKPLEDQIKLLEKIILRDTNDKDRYYHQLVLDNLKSKRAVE